MHTKKFNLMRWVQQYKKECNVNIHYRKPIDYKMKKEYIIYTNYYLQKSKKNFKIFSPPTLILCINLILLFSVRKYISFINIYIHYYIQLILYTLLYFLGLLF